MIWIDQLRRWVPGGENLLLYRRRIVVGILVFFMAVAWVFYAQHKNRSPGVLLNLGFDASRPALESLDEAWSAASEFRVSSAYAGSIDQTESLVSGLVADSVCLSSPSELDRLSRSGKGLVAPDWRTRFPADASPFTSIVVLVVRAQASETIRDWPDLFDVGSRVALPDPRISGVGQYGYLVLAYSAEQRFGSDPLKIAEAFRPFEFLPFASRRSADVFLRDRRFAAFLTWESEALRILENAENEEFVLVYPSFSLEIEAVVALIEPLVDRRGSREAAERYLNYYFSPEGQTMLAAAGFRPRMEPSEVAVSLPAIPAYTVESLFGSWEEAWKRHLGPEGSFMRLMAFRNARLGGTE